MRHLFFLFIISICLVNCGPDNSINEEPTSNEDGDFLICSINDEDFESKDFGAYAIKDFDADGTTNIYGTIDLAEADEQIILIRVDDNADLDSTLPFDEDNHWASVKLADQTFSSLPVVGGSGSITITERTDIKIAGSFSFYAYHTDGTGEQVEVIDGSFDVSYQ